MVRSLGFALPLVLFLVSIPMVVSGQVVQLPVIHQFSVYTTVLVPDRGRVVIGRVDRYRAGGVWLGRGLPGVPPNRAFGYDASRQQATVTATIIDHQEWDRTVLEAATKQERLLGTWTSEIRSGTAGRPHAGGEFAYRYLPPYIAASAQDSRPLTGAELQSLRQQRQQAREQTIQARLTQARRLAANGKTALAQSMLKRLLSDAHGDTRTQIQNELRQLSP